MCYADSLIDLEPFVAVSPVDKMMAEKIAELCRHRQRIQVLSLASNVMHAECFLEDAIVEYPGMKIGLRTVEPLPVGDLQGFADLHVLMGGHWKGKMIRLAPFSPIVMDEEGDLPLMFEDGGHNMAIRLQLRGAWSRQEWQEILATPGFPAHDWEQVGNFVLSNLHHFPGAILRFDAVYLPVDNQVDAIQELPEPARSRILNKIEEDKKEHNNMMCYESE